MPKGRGQETNARRIRSAHKGIAAQKVTILFIHGCAAQRASPKRAAEGAVIQRPGLDEHARTARRRRPGRMPQNDCSRPRRIACLCAERMETEHHNRPNRLVVMILPTQNTTAERHALAGRVGGRNHSHCNRRLLLSFPSLDCSFFMHTTPAASDHTFSGTRNPNASSTKS